MSRLLEFETLHNIRDLGGMETADGRRIAKDKLIRSGYLVELTEDEIERLAGTVDTVIDFRDRRELREHPDVSIPGTAYHHIPILEEPAEGVTREDGSDKKMFDDFLTKPEEMKQLICGIYRKFVMYEWSIAGYREFLRILMKEHDRAVLWHCTAGKDRAGIAAVLVEEILGVPREEIIADYMRTNDYLAEDMTRIAEQIKKAEGITEDPASDRAFRYLFGAEMDYIGTFYQTVEEQFGDMKGFLRNGLLLTEEDFQKMREMYLD